MEPDILRNALEHAFDEDPELHDRKASDVKSKYQHLEKQGYAYTCGTYLPGRECVAAPIFSIDEKISAAITYIVKCTGKGVPDQKKVRLLLDFCRRYSLTKSGYDIQPQINGSIAV